MLSALDRRRWAARSSLRALGRQAPNMSSASALALSVLTLAAGCSHEVKSPGVTLARVEPEIICSEQFPAAGIDLALRGTAFTPLPENVLAEPARVEIPSASLVLAQTLEGGVPSGFRVDFAGAAGGPLSDRLSWTNSEEMHLRVDESLDLVPGVYSLTLTNPDRKSSATQLAALAVVPPPRIDSVQPEALCNGFQDQHMIVNGANFVEVDGAPPVVTFSRAASAPVEYAAENLDGCTTIAGLARGVRICTSLSITVPASSLPEDTYTLSVSHPAPLGCTSTDSRSINVLDDGPVVFFVDPPVAYDGINTRATLFMTSVAEPFTVQLLPAGQTGPATELDASLVPGTTNRIQATVPAGQAAGTYDVVVNDDTGCQTTLAEGLTVTSDLSVEVGSVTEPFGYTEQSTPVTIFGGDGTEFAPTPRAFLNPSEGSADDVAIQLSSVTWVNADELTAVVPAGAPVGSYDLVVVNPDGSVGLLQAAFQSVANRPPVVLDILPQSIVNQAGQSIAVTGRDFAGSTLSLRCRTLSGVDLATPPSVTNSAETCDSEGSCSLTATIDGSMLQPGDVCVVRVANGDGSYGEFSGLGASNSSYNLSTPQAGRPMIEARRALVASAVKATSASRFLYAIGGDDGVGGEPFGSVEYAPINVFGSMSDFVMGRQALITPRSEHAGTQLGRYLFVFGGNDESSALSSGERALVLSPQETPVIDDLDLCLSSSSPPCFSDDSQAGGLPAGNYSYRVAALIDPTDPQNLGGETLASDPLPLDLPAVQNRGILVRLVWSAPKDALGVELTGITGYRVYRTPVDGVGGRDEVLIAELADPAARSYVDDGSAELGTRTPLPVGSTSEWQALPELGSARVGASAAIAADPATENLFHLYALLGDGLASYEHLEVNVLPNGRQTVGAGWALGAEASAVARSEFGTWVVTNTVSSEVPAGRTYLYLGGGLAAGGADGRVEAALVEAGGELAAFSDDPTAGDIVRDFSSDRTGYGTACAAGRLFLFGGNAAQVRADATAAEIISAAPELANNSWNNEGLTMTSARYRMGSSIQSAFIFLVGGETGGSGAATNSTELVIW